MLRADIKVEQEVATEYDRAARDVEEEHEKRYLTLLKNLEGGKVFKRDKVVRWNCPRRGDRSAITARSLVGPACPCSSDSLFSSRS